ncbi:MAG: hypothetical protein K0R61_2256 [Microvirga sp.]|nr:hypothetical protein [Microvirga sp.]MCE3246816.1 hypothetical protein [Geminicoccaceae bacterium]MDF2766857.1 hypothetical protein [Rhodospirillales bacterium]MDF2971806.1 hypothetical protein [Microvirga sp.]
MHLSRFMVALFAVALAVFPLSGARALGLGGHHQKVAAGAQHGHHPEISHHATTEAASGAHDCSEDEHGSGHPAPGCCDMGACHAMALTASVVVATPASFGRTVVRLGDEQVRGEFFFRLDRPPRTV